MDLAGITERANPYDKDVQYLIAMAKWAEEARKALVRCAEMGPPSGEKHDGIACAFCDMGGAGYASRGDGYHDDECGTALAQECLAKYPEEKK